MKDDDGNLVLVLSVALILVATVATILLLGYIMESTPSAVPDIGYIMESTPSAVPDIWAYPADTVERRNFTITFIDVGQGDAMYIQLPMGGTVLVDAGTEKSCDHIIDVMNGTPWIGNLVVTHPHADHTGCIEEITSMYPAMSTRNNTEMFAGDGGYLDMFTTMKVLNPQFSKRFSDENDNSVVLLITYHNSTLLLTGDSEMASEDCYIDKLPHIDVLKAGHHGSDSSTSAKLLAKVTPDYCIISVGKDNRYGHPGQTTLDWMGYYGCEIHRTDMEGDITMTTDGETWAILQ